MRVGCSSWFRRTLLLGFVAYPLLGPFGGGAAAQRVTVQLDASPRRLAVGETLRVKLTAVVESELPVSANLPMPEALQMLSWEVQRPVSVRVGPGGRRRVTQRYIDWRELRAERPGRWTLGPAEVFVGGRTVRSAPLTVVVTGRAARALPDSPRASGTSSTAGAGESRDAGADAPNGGDAGAERAAVADAARFDAQAFLRTVASVRAPYVGQPVEVSVFLYTDTPLAKPPVVAREPSTEGFWVQDLLPPSRRLRPSRQVVRGRSFQVYELRRFVVQPLRTGTLRIGAPRVEVRLSDRIIDDLFGGFFGGGGATEPIHREGEPLSLQVRALPDPKRARVPVGRFGAMLRLSPDRIDAPGASASLILEVEGDAHPGDLKPSLPLPGGLRLLRDAVRDDVRVIGRRLAVHRRITWTLEASRPGTYRLGPVAFDVFDPDTEDYVRVESGRVVLRVAPGAVSIAPRSEPDDGGVGVGPVSAGRDDPIASLGPWPSKPRRWIPVRADGPPPWSAWALAACWGVLGLWWSGRRGRAGARRSENRERRTAWRNLLSLLERLAGEVPPASPADRWLGGLERLLFDAGEVSLGEPVRALGFDAIERRLAARVGEALAGRFVRALRAVEALRFGGSEQRVDPKRCTALLREAREVLDGLQRAAWSDPNGPEGGASRGSLTAFLLLAALLGGDGARALGSEQESLSSLWDRAEEAYGAGQWEEASRRLRTLVRLAPGSGDLWRALGLAEARAGRLGGARAALLRALWVEPADAAAASDLRRVVTALHLRQGGTGEAWLGAWDWGRPWPPASRRGWPWWVLGAEWLWCLFWAVVLLGLARRFGSRGRLASSAIWVGMVLLGGGAAAQAMGSGPWVSREAGVLLSRSSLWDGSEPPGAPTDGAGADSVLPEGAVLRLGEERAGFRWVVTEEGGRGWVSADSVASLRPSAPWPEPEPLAQGEHEGS